ncbi:hypothetical protein Pmani_035249 [Petrolisthes manimaculis]|uniref:Palmitoyl-protein thioesterase ABHD10, mitochondrial n=1 Tax=Petrolisthes manimaculis TaxID=1843537 RepID=A0AAE1NMR1_9EUCA|nr:hypothetical protein Pmani_035249 [Petrolisthes manimaculis]
MEKQNTNFLKVNSGQPDERRLAYVKDEGTRSPGVLFIPGFMGHKDADKPKALHNFCKKIGLSFLRYDPTALGESEGLTERKDARFAHWLQDAEEVLLQLTDGPQLVIGSSMGGWIASLLAKKNPDKFHSLLLLAPSVNFSEFYIQKIRSKAPAPLLELLEKGGNYEYVDPKYGPYPLSLRVFEEMVPYELPLESEDGFTVSCPVRIIHGTQDNYSPYETSLKLMKAFNTSDLQLVYVKGADHHLDTSPGLDVVFDTISKMAISSKL